MKILRILGRIIIALLLVIVLLVAVIFGIRMWNQSSVTNVQLDNRPPDTAGVAITEFTGDYARGFHLVPEQRKHPGTVVVFGGSDGTTNARLAAKIAEDGREVYALNFFGQPGQQEYLESVPLELFEDVLPHASKPISVVGASKGSELALLLSTYYPEIDNVALIAPGAHHWQGLAASQQATPSFTWEGKEIPFISFNNADPKVLLNQGWRMMIAAPVALVNTYSSALANTPEADREKARIKVENSKARIFIVAGKQDQMWDSAGAAELIQEHAGDRTEIHLYPDAGHAVFAPPEVGTFVLGGSEEANTAMGKDALEKLLKWLP